MFVPRVALNVRNYHGDSKWIPGTVLKKLGPVTYSVIDSETTKIIYAKTFIINPST